MIRISRVIILLSTAFLVLAACQSKNHSASQSMQSLEDQYAQRIDAPVIFEEGIQLLQLPEAERVQQYQHYDEIIKDSAKTVSATNYPSIEAIGSEQDVDDFLTATYNAPRVLLFGFDACPYCQAFVPKVSQLAQELNVTLYYYDTVERSQDQTFMETIQSFGIETVPHAFVVEKAEPTVQIDHHSSMEDIETFLKLVSQES